MQTPDRTHRLFSIVPVCGVVISGAALVGGCGKEEPPPPPPPPPAVVKVDPMANVRLDSRVQWPDNKEAWSPELAEAIADLANGIVQGDVELIRGTLGSQGRRVLSIAMSDETGGFVGGEIEAVRINVLHRLEDGGAELGIGIQEPGGAYLTGWIGRQESGGQWVFDGAPCVAFPSERVSMLDADRLVEPSLGGVATVRVDIDERTRRLLSGESGGSDGDESRPRDPQSDPFRMPTRRQR